MKLSKEERVDAMDTIIFGTLSGIVKDYRDAEKIAKALIRNGVLPVLQE